MSITYTPTTNFGAKDSLPANDPAKVIKGAEFTTEYTAIQSAFALAAPAASPTITGTATFDDVSITNGLTVDGTTLVVDDVNNNVGIGTDSPVAPLDVRAAADVHVGIDDQSGTALIYAANDADQTSVVPMKFQANSFIFNGASERMRIDSSGNVGIGTDTPSFATGSGLEIQRVAADATLRLENTGNTAFELTAEADVVTYNSVSTKPHVFEVGSVERMRIDASGNVGIGTDSPGQKLEVAAATGTLAVSSTTSGNSSRLFMFNTTDGLYAELGNDGSDMIFKPQGGERMRIDGVGNVGIGTTTPVSYQTGPALNIGDTSDTYAQLNFTTATNGIQYIGFGDDVLGTARYQGLIQFDHNNNTMGFGAGAKVSADVTIDASGNVGIGETPPADAKLSVRTAGDDSRVRVRCSGGPDNDAVVELFPTSSNGAQGYSAVKGIGTGGASGQLSFHTGDSSLPERMRIDASGNVLVGSSATSKTSGAGIKLNQSSGTASQWNISVVGDGTAGDTGYTLYDTGGATYKYYVTYAGQIYATTTSIAGISDASLKENVRDLDKGLDTIMNLQPRRFDWKNGDDTDVMGFIAQEVEEVMPELVTDYQHNDEETKKSLKMGDMIPAMVKAIQEQQAMIEELKAEVEALKNA